MQDGKICEVCFAPIEVCFCGPVDVTAPVTDADLYNCLPEFLDRSKGEWVDDPEKGKAALCKMTEHQTSERREDHLTPRDREVIAELSKRLPSSTEKSRGRIGKMKANMADRAALKAGKQWDFQRGGWK